MATISALVERKPNWLRQGLQRARTLWHRAKHSIQRKIHRAKLRRVLRKVPALPIIADSPILFFSPEAGVTPHFAAQCLVARTLKELGHRVIFLRCFRAFIHCPVMDMHRLPHEGSSGAKHEVCLSCVDDALRMLQAYGLESLDVRALGLQDLQRQAREALRAAPADLKQFKFEGISFGQLSAMDLALVKKVFDLDSVSDDVRRAWLNYIHGSLLAYLLSDRLCKQFTLLHLVHHNDYSLMLGARLAAQKHGIPVTSVTHAAHLNLDRRRFIFRKQPGSIASFQPMDAWCHWRTLALSRVQVCETGADIVERLGARGSHIFSPAKSFTNGDLRTSLGLARDRKLIVAFTSSLDEMTAIGVTQAGLGFVRPTDRQPFPDQIGWLQSLIRFVGERDDLQLAVRIHPREGRTKHGGGASQHLARLRTAFGSDPGNCRFFWPEDPVSSYDLGELADVALISWSTIGLEMARLGIPVLASTHGLGFFPHDDFLEWAGTADEYFHLLLSLLRRPATVETVSRAFRWYNLFHLGMSLDLGDVVPTFDYNGLPPFKRPAESSAIEEIIAGGRDILAINHSRQIRAQHVGAEREEADAIQAQLRRLVRFLMTGQDPANDFPLILTTSDELTGRHQPGGATIACEDGVVKFFDGQTVRSRYSPLCSRLVPLCAQATLTVARQYNLAG